MVKQSVNLMVVWLAVALLAVAAPAASVRTLRTIVAGGDRFVPLQDLAAFYGLTLRYPGGKGIALANKWTTLTLDTEARKAVLNGTTLWLHAPVQKIRGYWCLNDVDVRNIVDPLMRPSGYLGARGYNVVVLDAGHGGKDNGASSRKGLEEKRAVLDITKRVRTHLAKAGVKVFLTRETDVFLELETRPAKALALKADVFVSIHLNSVAASLPKGVETYVLSVEGYPSTAEASGTRPPSVVHPGNRFNHSSTILGYHLQKALRGTVATEDRGLRRARFVVLRNAPCPSALVECGFLSNTREEALLLTSAYRETLARAIAQGILNYLNLVKKARVENLR